MFEAKFPSPWEGLGEGLRPNNISIYWRWRQHCFDNEPSILSVCGNVDASFKNKT